MYTRLENFTLEVVPFPRANLKEIYEFQEEEISVRMCFSVSPFSTKMFMVIEQSVA